MAGTCKTTRVAWQHKNPPTSNPHVAYVTRFRRDAPHMEYCLTLEQMLCNSAEIQLSCWCDYAFNCETLPPKIRTVMRAVAEKLGVQLDSSVQLSIKDKGIILRGAEGPHSTCRRRPHPTLLHSSLGRSHWALYFRNLLLPTLMAGRQDKVPSLVNNRLNMRAHWRKGKPVCVLRSQRGAHAGAHVLGEERPPKGAFVWCFKGIAQENYMISVTEVNPKHLFSNLLESTQKANHCDVHCWDTTVKAWP